MNDLTFHFDYDFDVPVPDGTEELLLRCARCCMCAEGVKQPPVRMQRDMIAAMDFWNFMMVPPFRLSVHGAEPVRIPGQARLRLFQSSAASAAVGCMTVPMNTGRFVSLSRIM